VRYTAFLSRFLDLVDQSTERLSVREFDSAIASIRARNELLGNGPQLTTPFAVINVDCHGNFSTFSPELLGLAMAVSEEVEVAVNLGDATSSLILVNLSIAHMESILGERGNTSRVGGRSKVEQFFSCFPEYPCFRISLPPRMGYVLGGLGIAQVRCPLSRPDLWLCVSSVPD
jgi:hypothetical protein